MTIRARFDVVKFVHVLGMRRFILDLAWDDVARQARVLPSVLTHMQQGGRPDVDTLYALACWADLNLHDFMQFVKDEP